MTKKFTYTAKSNGDQLTAAEWNNLAQDVDAAVDAINNGGGGSSVTVDPHVYFDGEGKHNLNITTTAEDQYQDGNKTKGGKINIEPISDLQIKPGDDISLCSHHRENPTEVSVKVIDGNDNPVKLQLNAANIVLTTKDKGKTKEKDENGEDTSTALYDDPNVMNVTVNSAKNTRGYLKVRAQAIDLRCEEHGGIALQPKGEDGQGHMNKIKFEHGGGDGLEFGTFNAEKTSIFTDEYRFNKDGVWKMATRTKVASDKVDQNDSTTAYKYTKAADDFYDNIDNADEQATTKDIIKTAYAMNGKVGVHTKITNKGALEIGTSDQYVYLGYELPSGVDQASVHSESINVSANPTFIINKAYSMSEIDAAFYSSFATTFEALEDQSIIEITTASDQPTTDDLYEMYVYVFQKYSAPSIKIDSGAELKLGGILDFGSSFNFGETDNGIEFQYKLTKKNNTKDCGVLKVVGVNNHATNNLTVEGETIAPGQTGTIAQCSVLDIIKLVNYMKTNNQGPWAANL